MESECGYSVRIITSVALGVLAQTVAGRRAWRHRYDEPLTVWVIYRSYRHQTTAQQLLDSTADMITFRPFPFRDTIPLLDCGATYCAARYSMEKTGVAQA